jgi:hypothetical protein
MFVNSIGARKRVKTELNMTTSDNITVPVADELDSSQSSLTSQKHLSDAELTRQVLRMVKNRKRVELMILELMEEYSFRLSDLKELLRGTVLNHPLFPVN